MKKIYYKIMLMFVTVTLSATLFTGCKDEVLPTATRLFRPVIADDKLVTGLDADTVPYIRMSWDKYADANQYVVKVIASDGTDSASITTDSTGCEFSNLKFDKEYNVKIHSLNTTTKLESKDYIASIATPDFPTQLVNITTSNIIDTQVRIIWNTVDGSGNATVFDSIKVFNTTNDSVVAAVAVTTSELTAGQKIIRKLSEKTKYRVEAYQNGKYKGKKLFTTTAAESYSGLVIDLRGLTAEDSYKYFSVGSGSMYVNTVDSIVKANPNQSITFVLQGGVTYRLPTLLIPSTTGVIKFVTGLSLNGLASFAVSGNFAADLNGTIGGISCQKIFFTDAPLESKKRTDANYAGTYLFNSASTASGYNVKSLKFTDCTIKYKRDVVRVQTASIIDTIAISNCVFDSIGGYGITNADNTGAQILNVSVSNSTFSNCDKLFINSKPTAFTVNQFDVINSTIVYQGTDKSIIFDFSGCKVTNGLNVTNCLFGRTGTTAAGTLLTGVTGWKGLLSPNFQSCYLTSDYKNVLGTDGVTPTNPIVGTSVTTDTPGTFQAPATGNFKVTNKTLITAKAGDPRWY